MSPGVWIGLAAQLGVSTHDGSGFDSRRLGVSVFLDPSDQSEHVANKVNKKIKTGIRKGQSQYKLNSTKKNQNGGDFGRGSVNKSDCCEVYQIGLSDITFHRLRTQQILPKTPKYFIPDIRAC